MFSNRLQQARRASGLSLRDLGDRIGVSHAAIKKYEDGKAKPSSDILLKLSKELGVRTEYFFRPDSPPAFKNLSFRKHINFPKKQLDIINYKVIENIERRLELENLFPTADIRFSGIKNLPISIDSYDEIEKITNLVRDQWKLGMGPIPDLIDTLEMQGIRVFKIALDQPASTDRHFDGLHTIIDKTPIIVINNNFPGDRQRFTLAHELGHLILENRLNKKLDEERACDRFAGAFLFPKESVINELGESRTSIELRELDYLKQIFGASMLCIVHRVEELKIIKKSTFDIMYRDFKSKGWYTTEPGDQYPKETTHFFNQFVFHALAEECIGEAKAAELLNMPLTEFRRIRAMGGKDANTHQ
jgi:Zn-dependent peptidase ImmA (M78 family)/DNA-binding XRE family transcriptional regulator